MWKGTARGVEEEGGRVAAAAAAASSCSCFGDA